MKDKPIVSIDFPLITISSEDTNPRVRSYERPTIKSPKMSKVGGVQADVKKCAQFV
jgi:hypothetical protein